MTTIGAAIDVVKSHAKCSINILSLLAGGVNPFLTKKGDSNSLSLCKHLTKPFTFSSL